MIAALGDDLNTPGAIAALHKLANDGDAAGLKASALVLGLLLDDMGAWAVAPQVDLSQQVSRLVEARSAAMETKDFSEVDRLKAVYVEAGLEVRMSKAGVELIPGPGFDASRLGELG